jgi:hypothetical protein
MSSDENNTAFTDENDTNSSKPKKRPIISTTSLVERNSTSVTSITPAATATATSTTLPTTRANPLSYSLEEDTLDLDMNEREYKRTHDDTSSFTSTNSQDGTDNDGDQVNVLGHQQKKRQRRLAMNRLTARERRRRKRVHLNELEGTMQALHTKNDSLREDNEQLKKYINLLKTSFLPGSSSSATPPPTSAAGDNFNNNQQQRHHAPLSTSTNSSTATDGTINTRRGNNNTNDPLMLLLLNRHQQEVQAIAGISAPAISNSTSVTDRCNSVMAGRAPNDHHHQQQQQVPPILRLDQQQQPTHYHEDYLSNQMQQDFLFPSSLSSSGGLPPSLRLLLLEQEQQEQAARTRRMLTQQITNAAKESAAISGIPAQTMSQHHQQLTTMQQPKQGVKWQTIQHSPSSHGSDHAFVSGNLLNSHQPPFHKNSSSSSLQNLPGVPQQITRHPTTINNEHQRHFLEAEIIAQQQKSQYSFEANNRIFSTGVLPNLPAIPEAPVANMNQQQEGWKNEEEEEEDVLNKKKAF